MLAATILVSDKDGGVNRIGVIEIINDGTGNKMTASYKVRFIHEETLRVYEARVENYSRTRGSLALLRSAIDAIEKKEGLYA